MGLSLLFGIVLIAFGAAPMDWHNAKPIGLDVVAIDQRAHTAVCAAGAPVAKVRIERGIFGTTADQVAALVADCGLELVVLHAGVTGYDWRALQAEWHAGGWGDLVNDHPEISWSIEIGNEPEFAGMESGAVARTVTLETYKRLALGIGSGEPAWRDAYPTLRWLASLPLTMDRVAAFLSWIPDNSQGWIDQGSIGDWYDGVGIHIYGDYRVTDGHLWTVYNAVIRRPDIRSCAITEAGINGIPPAEGMRELAGLARWTPCFGVFAFAYFPEGVSWMDDPGSPYNLTDARSWDVMRAYNQTERVP